jgi:hypothetical protein
MKVKVIKEEDSYQFSLVRKGDVCKVSYEFDDIYIVVKTGGEYDSHAMAVPKSNCEILDID